MVEHIHGKDEVQSSILCLGSKVEHAPEKIETAFEIDKSGMKEAYLLLGAHTPLELSNLYTAEDQKLMRSGEWDYDNVDLIVNKAKEIIEGVDPGLLTEDESDWRKEILWFWYHHAMSCAIWRYKDKEAARVFAKKALEYQGEGHPNKITKLLDLLVNDQLEEAEAWVKTIKEESEKSTAEKLIEEYKLGLF